MQPEITAGMVACRFSDNSLALSHPGSAIIIGAISVKL